MDALFRSKPSVRKFTSDDLYHISKTGTTSGLWTVAVDSMKCALDLIKTANNTAKEDYLNLFKDMDVDEVDMDETKMNKKYNFVVENHDQRLLR